MIGRIVSIKQKNTATVLVTSTKVHPLYKKTFTRNKKFLVQDDLGVSMGDIVEAKEMRPISKNKHWKIVKRIGRSIEEMVEKELKEQAAEVIEEVMSEEKEKLVKNEKTENSDSKKEIIVDNSTKKTKQKKGGRTELSK